MAYESLERMLDAARCELRRVIKSECRCPGVIIPEGWQCPHQRAQSALTALIPIQAAGEAPETGTRA
jgi:hypothetical protein